MEEVRVSQEQKEETFAEWEARMDALFDKLFGALVECRRLEKQNLAIFDKVRRGQI